VFSVVLWTLSCCATRELAMRLETQLDASVMNKSLNLPEGYVVIRSDGSGNVW
jgi:hypothetical protein